MYNNPNYSPKTKNELIQINAINIRVQNKQWNENFKMYFELSFKNKQNKIFNLLISKLIINYKFILSINTAFHYSYLLFYEPEHVFLTPDNSTFFMTRKWTFIMLSLRGYGKKICLKKVGVVKDPRPGSRALP